MKLKLTLLAISCLCFFSSGSGYAQYRGSLTPSTQGQSSQDEALPPVPKIFSSKVTSADEAAKLDVLFNTLNQSLWNYAGTDFIYQKKLYSLIQPERFKLTRYAAEFETDLKDAMNNLNSNYKRMQDEISDARIQYTFIKEGIRPEDYTVLDPLWNTSLNEFEARIDSYFKMQNSFLNTYKSLTDFILRKGGSYYYDSSRQGVAFYNFGDYQFYGQAKDKLNKIRFEQRKLLRANPPANIDLSYLD